MFVTSTAVMENATTTPVISENIRQLRTKIGLTQEELAKYLDTSREQVSYYEAGSRTPSSTHLVKMADLFCVNEYDLFAEDLSVRSINVAFAFRASELAVQDLNRMAAFKKIVRNYLNMKKVLADE